MDSFLHYRHISDWTVSDQLSQLVVEALHVRQLNFKVVSVQIGVGLELVLVSELAVAAPFLP